MYTLFTMIQHRCEIVIYELQIQIYIQFKQRLKLQNNMAKTKLSSNSNRRQHDIRMAQIYICTLYTSGFVMLVNFTVITNLQ